MTITEVAGERLGGFKSGEGVSIWVNGVRTVGTVVLPGDAASLDPSLINQLLNESIGRLTAPYSRASNIFVASAAAAAPYIQTITSNLLNAKLFTECEMTDARVLNAAELTSSGQWIVIQARVATFIPGSRAYVIAESDRLIVGQAIVSKDGTVDLNGAVPLSALGAGAHRFRIIGSRQVGIVSADEQGQIILSDASMESIRTYDNMSTAAVHLDSPTRHITRFIPLHEGAPWWMLLVIVGLMLVGVRERRRLRQSQNAMAPAWRRFIAARSPLAPIFAALVVSVSCFMTLYFELILPALAIGVLSFIRLQRTPMSNSLKKKTDIPPRLKMRQT